MFFFLDQGQVSQEGTYTEISSSSDILIRLSESSEVTRDPDVLSFSSGPSSLNVSLELPAPSLDSSARRTLFSTRELHSSLLSVSNTTIGSKEIRHSDVELRRSAEIPKIAAEQLTPTIIVQTTTNAATTSARLIEEEERNHGTVGWHVYSSYILRSTGGYVHHLFDHLALFSETPLGLHLGTEASGVSDLSRPSHFLSFSSGFSDRRPPHFLSFASGLLSWVSRSFINFIILCCFIICAVIFEYGQSVWLVWWSDGKFEPNYPNMTHGTASTLLLTATVFLFVPSPIPKPAHHSHLCHALVIFWVRGTLSHHLTKHFFCRPPSSKHSSPS